MKKLYICEKFDVANTLASYMGIKGGQAKGAFGEEDVVITWCSGHLLEVYAPEDYDPSLKSWSLATLPILPENWMVKVKSAGYIAKQYKVIEKLLKKAPLVVIATDFDREGEVIGRSLLDKCGYKGTVKRILITAQDDQSLKEALQNEFDAAKSLPSYFAGLGRQRSDWMIGMNMTRFYTLSAREKGFDGVWSVGRVQTAALNLIVERDKAIQAFESQDFFEVLVHFACRGQSITAKVSIPNDFTDEERRLLSSKKAKEIAADLEKLNTISITRILKKPKSENPPLPLNMSYAQKQSSELWGWKAAKTLEVAQKLYESHKLTSYPRTDSRYLKESMFSEVQDTIKGILANDPGCGSVIDFLDLNLKGRAWDDSEIKAHHAIIPTRRPEGFIQLNDDEKALYQLIRKYYLYQFSSPCKSEVTTVEFQAGDYRLITKGTIVIDDGWRKTFNVASEDKGTSLPELTEGEEGVITKVEILTRKTTPPLHYTDGTLIDDMENAAKLEKDPDLKKMLKETSGIGTEATRAGIIEVLRQRELVEDAGKKIIATDKGKTLIEAVDPRLKSIGSTALMEQALDDIANGSGRLNDYLEGTRKLVMELCKNERGIPVKAEQHLCLECNKPLRRITKRGKDGYDFWGCTGYPSCKKSYQNKGDKPDLTGGK